MTRNPQSWSTTSRCTATAAQPSANASSPSPRISPSCLTARPFATNTATPAECQRVLEAVRLWGFVQERAEGLHVAVAAGTLSAGQRQLFSLGRAMLRAMIRQRSTTSFPRKRSDNQDQGGILLLDEVSSSVDRETEQMMQEIIRAEFRQHTVIAVSHRLEMIMDFDRGEVVEVGNLALLKGEAGSLFGELVTAAGA